MTIVSVSTTAVFSVLGQTPPGPIPFGTFLSYDPESLQPIPFYATPAYFQNSDAIYAVSGPDNSSSDYTGDDFSYAISSGLNATPIYQILLESPGSRSSDCIQASAIGSDGTTYFVTPSGIVFAFNPDGTLKWSYYGINQKGIEVHASPSVGLDGNIYVACDDGNNPGIFYCIDPDLGLPKWILRVSTTSGSTPDMDASPLFTPMGIYDVDESGYLHFITFLGQEYTLLQTGGSSGGSSPAITGQGHLCIGTANGELQIVDTNPPDLGGNGILQTVTTDGNQISASPVIGPDGNIYVGTAAGNFFAVQLPANEGTQPPTVIAETSLGSLVSPTTTAVGSDARVYVGTSSDASGSSSSSGSFYSMHLRAVSGQTYPYQFIVDWQTNIPTGSQGGGFIGSPLIAQVGANHNQNVVYEPNVNGNLYAFQTSAGPSTTTWSTFQGDDQRKGSSGSGFIQPAAEQQHLWSAQLGGIVGFEQTGKAAYGNTTNDFWNVENKNSCGTGWEADLANSSGSESVVTELNFNAPCSDCCFEDDAVATKPFNDIMMKYFMTFESATETFYIGAPSQGFKAGAPALYDIYLYAYGGQYTVNGTTYSYNSQFTISPPGADPLTGASVSTLTTSSAPPPDLNHFIEGDEYVVFRNVPLSSSHIITITITADPNSPKSFPLINGIQIVGKQ